MNPNLLAAAPRVDAAAPTARLLTGVNAFSRYPGVLLTVDMADEAARRAVDHWPYEARALAEGLGWNEGEWVARHGQRSATLFLGAPIDGLATAREVAQHAWARAVAYIATQDGDVQVLADPLPALQARYVTESMPLGALRAMVDAAIHHGVSWQIADDLLTLGSGSGSETWPVRAVPPVEHVAWSRRLDVPTVLTMGEPGAREVGAIVTVLVRASGVGAVFGSGLDEAQELVRDREVSTLVLKLSATAAVQDVLPVSRADVAVVTTMPDPSEALAVIAERVGPFGRLVLNADVPDLVAFAATLATPVVWYSLRADSTMVMQGVAAWGDGAAIVDGHLMVAYDGIWNDAGRVDRLPVGVTSGVALAAALAAMCAGVPLGKIVAAMPA